ncbi:cyclin-domain-containing protein [Clathrospora elynae]|uniref:Cyclin-domain-containing protein n=1 Tax=Clathrospora elynae TaxID=706981 RepID=A0A6A5SI30_9PLEO|nr:cyclin-domain-containing protein [Clathrospora elynae]
MLTSSPTISAPPSPNTTFHTPSHRPYHASRHTSASSSAHSPRFAVSSAAAAVRRYDAPPTPKAVFSVPSPVPTVASSPQGRKRSYADAATQYTPPALPPTYRPQSQPAPNNTDNGKDQAHSAPLTVPAIAPTQRGGASATPVITEPSEPQARVDPLPATPAQDTQPPSRRTPQEKSRSAAKPEVVPTSPAKRARHAEPDVKVMPLQYETCDVKDLGVLVSDMLMELVRLNDGYPLQDGTLTRFHSRAPPGISIRDYLARLIVHATLSPPILLSMVYYVDKLCAMYPAFTISSLTVHRFLITAATVAAKGLSDSFWTNSLYARVGGVSVRELALLELEFLRKLDWRIVPKPEVLVDYYKGLVDRGTGYVIEQQSESEATSSTQVHTPNGSATGIHTTESGTS